MYKEWSRFDPEVFLVTILSALQPPLALLHPQLNNLLNILSADVDATAIMSVVIIGLRIE